MFRSQDLQALQRAQPAQAGVFSTADLQNLLAERHPAAFTRRVRGLIGTGALERFSRGWYVTPGVFSAITLSQRIAPASYVSSVSALARALVVGVAPEHHVWSAKVGRSRVYEGAGCRVVHLGLQPELYFGFSCTAGGCWAVPEKALLDALYFHLRGARLPFDVYSDLNLQRIDRAVLAAYLTRYRNPKFRAFAVGVLDAYR